MKNSKPHRVFIIVSCLTIITFSFTGQPRKLDPVAYTQWVINPLNGLQSKITEGKYDFIVNFLPADYMIIKESRGKQLTKKDFSKRQEELSTTEYYSLLIDLNNGKRNAVKSLIEDTKIPANDLVKYLAYDLQHDLQLVKGSDTLQCKFLHFEETYEATSYARFLLMFDVAESNRSEDRIILMSLPWMNQRKLTFTIESKKLNSVPKVLVKK